ncbi:MAG TPA: RNA pseudouridine synthase [Opitutaceae bacterium]|nr:RNA pseudouridine synthase [Opitutaceae bacterium]
MSGPGEKLWAALPLGRGVELIARDANGLAAFAKPAGVLSHPNGPKDEPRSLLQARYDLERETYAWTDASGAPAGLHLLNRLDSATSGVILAAADEGLAREIRAQFRRKQVHKVYVALVFGRPPAGRQTWRDRLAVEKRGARIRTSAGDGIPSECDVSVRRAAKEAGLALLQLEPRTGRSHQLRVQCARHGLPIAGDQTYGDFPRNREFAKRAGTKRLFLHSLATDFTYEWAGRKFSFSAQAPLPPEFEAAL